MPHNVAGGWGGRIRTFNLLIQSQLRYRCATPQTNTTGALFYRALFGPPCRRLALTGSRLTASSLATAGRQATTPG